MRNVLIIEPGPNCEYAIYAMTHHEFDAVFSGKGQNVEFVEDLAERMSEDGIAALLTPVWDRRIRKSEAQGIHGTLFFQMRERKKFYPTKNDEQMVAPFGDGPLNRWHTVP